MQVVAVLKKYQGAMTLREFAEFLGIGASTLSQVYTGVRRAGNDIHDAFLLRFPDAVTEYGQAQLADAVTRAQLDPAPVVAN